MKLDNEKIKGSLIYKAGRFLLTSAPFALLLSVVLFWVEMHESSKESEETITNLERIEQSLSTRYIGIFPDYLAKINEILEKTEEGAPIVIFEDVLYYGIFSKSDEFKIMIQNLINLSNNGHRITITHYGTDTPMFRAVAQESCVEKEYMVKFKSERRRILKEARESRNKGVTFRQVDSMLAEKYFAMIRDDDPEKFEESITNRRKPLYKEGDAKLFATIDAIRDKALGKDIYEITFADFFTMYQEISVAIKESLEGNFNSHIEFIELTDYLVLCCWSNSKEMLFALPGKFAADEIGFISHDKVIMNYIETQLQAARNRASDE